MSATALVRALIPILGLAAPLLSSAVPAPSAVPAQIVPADSIDQRLRTLLEADSVDVDSVDRLLREDSLAEERERTGPASSDSITRGAFPAPGVHGPEPLVTATVASAFRDSSSVRWELGASSDVIDEQFYEYRDEVFDTLSRTLVSEPEARVGGVFALLAEGTRRGGRVGWRLHDETSLGDLLQRSTLEGTWRETWSPRWTLVLAPWLDARHDRTFGRDLDEWHGTASARLRRWLDDDVGLEIGAGGEVLRTSGSGTDLLLDRNAMTLSAACDRAPLFGDESRAAYTFAVRQFPDSSERDHLEHAGEASWRHLLPGTGWIGVEADGARRSTIERVTSTRDNFWRIRTAADLETGIGAVGWLKGRLESEWLRYDLPDSVIYDDEQVLRAALLPGLRRGVGRSVVLGPRVERLRSPQQHAEDYDELAIEGGVEWSSDRSFWTATPVAGHRRYLEALEGSPLTSPGLHSSYDFLELGVVSDHRLARALRLRGFLDGRLESHSDPADNSRSLYFSLDVRMLF